MQCRGSARLSEQSVDERRRELGLRNEPERGAAGHERAEIGAVEARDEDHLRRSLELGQSRGDLEPVEVRQLHVHDRHVRAVRLRFLDPTGAGFGFGDDGEAGPLEQLSRRSAEGAVVVDDENAMIHLLIVPARRSDPWCSQPHSFSPLRR